MKNTVAFVVGLVENIFTTKQLTREPESEMVVETPIELEDYNLAMKNSSWIYNIFSAELISGTISQCTRVLDIGCGSGDLLLILAKAHPHITFVGADQSSIALEAGKRNAAVEGVTNVIFVQSDLETLQSIPDQDVDGVITRFTLHHLLDETSLVSAAQSIKRILKPQGAIWIGDFQKLNSLRLIKAICYRKAGKIVSDLFYESLRAAFDFDTLDRTFKTTFTHGKSTLTRILPLYYVFRTPLSPLSLETKEYYKQRKQTFRLRDRSMLASIRFIFWLGGYYSS